MENPVIENGIGEDTNNDVAMTSAVDEETLDHCNGQSEIDCNLFKVG